MCYYWNYEKNSWKQFGQMYKFKPWEVHDAKANDNGIICFSMSPHK